MSNVIREERVVGEVVWEGVSGDDKGCGMAPWRVVRESPREMGLRAPFRCVVLNSRKCILPGDEPHLFVQQSPGPGSRRAGPGGWRAVGVG